MTARRMGLLSTSTYLIFVGFEGSKTETSPSVESVLSKACLWFSGESHAGTFRICFPYVFINNGFNGFMSQITTITVFIS